jgi:hypothetical protein
MQQAWQHAARLKQLHFSMPFQELSNMPALAACTALQHTKYNNGYEDDVYSCYDGNDDPCYSLRCLTDIIAVVVKLPDMLLLELPAAATHGVWRLPGAAGHWGMQGQPAEGAAAHHQGPKQLQGSARQQRAGGTGCHAISIQGGARGAPAGWRLPCVSWS